MPSLQILKGPNEGAVIQLEGDRFVLGRNPDCAVVFFPSSIATVFTPVTCASSSRRKISAASVVSPSTVSISSRPTSDWAPGSSSRRAPGKPARMRAQASSGEATRIDTRINFCRARRPASNSASTTAANNVATIAIGTAPRPQAT